MAVAAACFRAKLADQPSPAGERSARVLAGYRRIAGDPNRIEHLSCRTLSARRDAAGALSVTHRAGAAAELIARSASAHTRRVYASALGQLAAWLAVRSWAGRRTRYCRNCGWRRACTCCWPT